MASWILWAFACVARSAEWVDAPPGGVDVAIVPGCPTLPDGHLSDCQWRRAAWAAHLYEAGLARHFITSGGAAHTPFVEATAIARGMEAMGVPSKIIFQETQALHTDQNTGYALALAKQLGFETIGMASDPGHSDAMCRMAMRWGRSCTNFRMVYELVLPRLADLPSLVLDAIPTDQWIAEHREPRMATSPRYRSFVHYTGVILKAWFTGSRAPEPPGPEPSMGAATAELED